MSKGLLKLAQRQVLALEPYVVKFQGPMVLLYGSMNVIIRANKPEDGRAT